MIRRRILPFFWVTLLAAAGCGRQNAGENLEAEALEEAALEEEADQDSPWYSRGERIEDQTFETSLDPIGKVTFASYWPGGAAGKTGDAVFLIEKNGVIWQQLEGMTENNCRKGLLLGRVEAVSFPDSNQDGYDDILLILRYETDQKEDYTEVRYYQGSKTGSFDLERELSQEMTEEIKNPTVADAKAYLRDKFGFEQETDQARTKKREFVLDEDVQLELLMGYMDVWRGGEDGGGYQYAVTDLDQNGRLEILSSSVQGTGLYTYTTCYEVNEEGDGIYEVILDSSQWEGGPDLIQKSLPVYVDRAASVYWYLAEDFTRISPTEYMNTKMILVKKGDELEQQPLAYEEIYAGEDSETHFYYRADGEEITKSEYDGFADSRYADLDKRTARLGWVGEAELDFYYMDRLYEQLKASWGSFDIY